MAVRPVVRFPAAVLKLPAAEVAPGEWARSLARDLVDTMRASPECVGIAAPQVGVGARVFCVDVSGHRKAVAHHGLIVVVNPTIEESHGSSVTREGCMSLPDFTGNVRRAVRVVVRGLSPDGGRLEIDATGFEARALQHEIDHLDGLLFLDRVASVTHDVFRRKRYAR